MPNSTHKVEVVKLNNIKDHPNADKLQIVEVWGYICCIQKGQFGKGDLAAYIPPDNVCDTNKPWFHFLGKHNRIRVKRLRGIVSQGLLVKPPFGAKEGDDVAEQLGVTHYEPPMNYEPPNVSCESNTLLTTHY